MDRRNARWRHAIKTEERVRLHWYMKNRELLIATADIPTKMKVDPVEMEKQIMAARKENYQESRAQNHPMMVSKEPTPPAPGPISLSFMKSVPPEITDLIYKNPSNQGRVTYLAARVKSLPEDRYSVPVCNSFIYGWNMWDCAKTLGRTKLGKSAVVRQTFYRRRAGVERNPDWYTAPDRMSPTICNS